MLIARTPVVITYHSSLALLTELRGLLFRISVAERCVYAFISFFSSALPGGPENVGHDFEGGTALLEKRVLLPLPCGIQAFVSDAGFFSFLRDSPFNYGQAHTA